MTLRKLSRTLLLGAGAVGMALGLTSCSNDHTVGYVYVLGTQYNQINVFREDNNNGKLTSVTSPVGSGGTDPIRAVVGDSSRFMWVLNAGSPQTGTIDSASGTTGLTGYASNNIVLFSIGGYGTISQQLTYQSQGLGSERIAVNTAGTYLFVLDQYAPQGETSTTSATISQYSTTGAPTNYPCQDASNPNVYHPVGSITVFSIDASTGRLQVVPNQREQGLSYFPVGCNPVDFRVTSSYVYTMDAGSSTNGDVETVNVQNLSAGQLTPSQVGNIQVPDAVANTAPVISAINGDNANKYIYLLDTTHSYLYLYTIGTNGALTTISGSPYNDLNNSAAGGPVQSIVDSTAKYLYVVNGGPAAGVVNPSADLGGFSINATTGFLDTVLQNSPTNLSLDGTISDPVCIFEDPTDQFIYAAGAADNSITGRRIDPNTGVLTPLNGTYTFPTVGTPSWCLGISSTL